MIIKKKISTNSRVLNELLTKYRNTFYAFCELINNSIQAKTSKIEIFLEYGDDKIDDFFIKSIIIKDYGHGVSQSEFENTILEIGTFAKIGGQGVGRFGALQIGKKLEIETVAFDKDINKFTFTKFPLNADELNNEKLQNIDFEIEQEILEDNQNPYYKVTISELYHNSQNNILKKNKLSAEFKKENFNLSIFEKYPDLIFNNKVNFIINSEPLKKEDFIIGKPSFFKRKYKNVKGELFDIDFNCYNVKHPENKVKVFFYINNAGIKTVANEFSFSSDWHTPDLGTWFIYLDSQLFQSDLFRNIDFADFGDKEWKLLKEFIKEELNEFFKSKNPRFSKFLDKLTKDKSTQKIYQNKKSETQVSLFHKTAYLIENDYKLLEKDENLRSIIYPLIDRAIQDKHFDTIIEEVLKISDDAKEKLYQLLKRTDLESVIYFSSVVAEKKDFLTFLHDITYGSISKVLRERSQLHKIIENELWIFGENYNGTPKLWSDNKIGNILLEIRDKHMNYQPTKEDDNLIEDIGENNITDLFFHSEKLSDNGIKEIMIVELKAPNCLINKKELMQIDDYAFTISQFPGLPTENVKL